MADARAQYGQWRHIRVRKWMEKGKFANIAIMNSWVFSARLEL